AVDADARHGRTRDAREQGATEAVAERVAEARLERLDDETAPVLGDDVLREEWTLCDEHGDFLPTGDRYMTPRETAGSDPAVQPPLSVVRTNTSYAGCAPQCVRPPTLCPCGTTRWSSSSHTGTRSVWISSSSRTRR